MKPILTTSLILITYILLPAQEVIFENSSILGKDETILPSITLIKSAAKEIIANSQSCALITIGEDDSPRARAMDPFPIEENFTVWFGTNPKSRKVSQIQKDPRVTLYYINKDISGYVVISGTAELVTNQTLKNKYWKREWESFYIDNRENYLLIKVNPIWMEVLSPKHDINNDTVTWNPPRINFNTENR
jgi:general stress protein 26